MQLICTSVENKDLVKCLNLYKGLFYKFFNGYKVGWLNYRRALELHEEIGDGTRNFEPRSSDEADTWAGTQHNLTATSYAKKMWSRLC